MQWQFRFTLYTTQFGKAGMVPSGETGCIMILSLLPGSASCLDDLIQGFGTIQLSDSKVDLQQCDT